MLNRKNLKSTISWCRQSCSAWCKRYHSTAKTRAPDNVDLFHCSADCEPRLWKWHLGKKCSPAISKHPPPLCPNLQSRLGHHLCSSWGSHWLPWRWLKAGDLPHLCRIAQQPPNFSSHQFFPKGSSGLHSPPSWLDRSWHSWCYHTSSHLVVHLQRLFKTLLLDLTNTDTQKEDHQRWMKIDPVIRHLKENFWISLL